MTHEPDATGATHVERVLEAAAELPLALGPVERAAALERLIERARVAQRGVAQPRDVGPRPRDALRRLFVGRAAVLERVVAQVERALGAAQPVLIEGEPGTGKTLLAATIHQAHTDLARRGSLVRVAHPAAPEAIARAARTGGGTLLVEEVATLSLDAQHELLRLLRAPGKRAPRVVATTRHDLAAAAASGWFVPELRDRLHVLRLRLPSLREHPAAIAELFVQLLRSRSAPDDPPAVTPDALAALAAHDWRGNVRELDLAARALRDWTPRGPVERSHVLRFIAQLSPAEAPTSSTPAREPAARAEPTLEALERTTIAERLTRHGWRQVETARSLGIDRKTLYRKIRQYGLEP